MWSARRILKDLADPELRRTIAAAFWKHGEPAAKMLATAQLAKALHFREDTLRKLPLEKKAELLAGRSHQPEFEQALEAALMHYHTRFQSEMMAAFLDRWNVPHVNGSIEVDDYPVPSSDQIRAAAAELSAQYDRRAIAIYLASAGLLMGDQWRENAWPVVDELTDNG
jgi:hypothetical protein